MPYAIWEGGLAELDISIPSKKIASEFNSLISPVIQKLKESFFENQRLTTLRDTLIPKLMAGDVNK